MIPRATVALLTAFALFARSAVAHAQPSRASSSPAISPSTSPRLAAVDALRAATLYDRFCTGCHGSDRTGNGPLARYLVTRPRDLAHAPFAWRSTRSGTAPTIDDVALTIGRGVPGAGMPGFGVSLRPGDRRLLARWLLEVRAMPPGEPLPVQLVPPIDTAVLARGTAVYARMQCASCHGTDLRGDGPAAALVQPRPFDLTQSPARAGADAAAILRTLRTGLDGTPMPAFEGAAPPDDLAALAAWVASRVPANVATLRAPGDPGAMHWLADDAPDEPSPLAAPTEASHAALERAFWDAPLRPQGAGPANLAPAERSLNPDRCARCHARQFEQFRATVHARAMGPGVLGQIVDMPAEHARACQQCHAPLDEQMATRAPSAAGSTSTANPDFDPELRSHGVACAACHLRDRMRFGPPRRPSAGLLASPGYPLTILSRFERGDFCAPCHQHTSDNSAGGHPILDTVNEWVAGPYFARGIQCQHCHMPDRDHTWRGAHDPDTVRQAVHVYGRLARDGAALAGWISVENTGAGHAFPGTSTPAAVLELEWLDAAGNRVGEVASEVFRRRLEYSAQGWVQLSDTRIAPGAERRVTLRSTNAAAVAVRWTLRFRPDEAYVAFYRRALGDRDRSAQGRALLGEALRAAERSPFVVRSGVLVPAN